MSHTSIVIPRDGSIGLGAADEPALVFRDRTGNVTRRVSVPDVIELHGLTLVEEDGEQRIWIADTAEKLYGGQPELYIQASLPGKVLQIDLNGNVLRRLANPDVAAYTETPYAPSGVVVDEQRFGGSGDIWVADGYGASLVHRYDAAGNYVSTLDGTKGAGRFQEPHDLLIDRRGAEPLLYVADRVHGRIQVFDLTGTFVRVVGEGDLGGPTQMAVSGEYLIVTDLLRGRLSIFDGNDRLVTHQFEHSSAPQSWGDLARWEAQGWPNALSAEGIVAPVHFEPEAFHTPHGIAVAPDGTVFVCEFALQGRVAVLDPTRC
ncbi:hypothetical protein [Streptomyces sp. NBC_00258]|uniref:hypothetical protein n=1 Tax=Streptomyces sp. NBC_00258 TaxID=2903642 RepID=UPI002E290D21|nr:hypothetical protein [Streptomyces sp. NBC_00258]